EEINYRVKKEVKVLFQHLLKFNERTLGQFMQELDRDYKERDDISNKLRCEIEEKKLELRHAEKALAYMKQ
ncbi:12789_t:CDS:1, partial [Entrophospora sp. SA101]